MFSEEHQANFVCHNFKQCRSLGLVFFGVAAGFYAAGQIPAETGPVL
jgi:hypothetical protein